MAQSRHILFVSRELLDEATHRVLEERGWLLALVPDVEPAYRRLHKSQFDLVILDLTKSTEGLIFIKRLRAAQITRTIPVLVLGEWGTGAPSLALSQGADAYEPKPINAERLATSIERLLTERAVAAGWNQ
jgi:DNA-binding response OmpR family regulator